MENKNGSIIRIFVNGKESVWSEELQARYLPIIDVLEKEAEMNYFEIHDEELEIKFIAKRLGPEKENE